MYITSLRELALCSVQYVSAEISKATFVSVLCSLDQLEESVRIVIQYSLLGVLSANLLHSLLKRMLLLRRY